MCGIAEKFYVCISFITCQISFEKAKYILQRWYLWHSYSKINEVMTKDLRKRLGHTVVIR